MKNLLSIGQFAKLCQTTTDTLVHYHHIGLLSPTHTCGSKRHRRMYDIGLYHTFYIIRSLSDSGFTLEEIKTFLTSDSSHLLAEALRQKELFLQEQLLCLKQTAQYFKNTHNLSHISSIQASGQPFIHTQDEPILLYATFLGYHPISSTSMITAMIQHKEQCISSNTYPYPMGFILPKKSLYAQNNKRILLFSPYPQGTATNKTPVQPAGEYAVILHKGSLESINESIVSLYTFIKENHYTITSDTYINFYHNSLPGTTDSFYLIKVRFCHF